ncbi:MAG: uroporphyrinogen-III C-methyltransferase [Rhodospirillales bacterium 20-64-7]|nr:MAG: uroporphyrinogen-III C-methyltransferase [Rhodospirillales bacterium 20-64-7]
MSHVFLIGAGPGDPELLTIKALRRLASADVVLHDSLVDARIIGMAPPAARRIDVGKRCGRHSASQSEICSLLVAEALSGQVVVRLKGGDPMMFGRATEEIDALRAHGISFEIIPGITAATAAAATLELSLTKRGVARSVHFLTGHGAEGGLPAHDWVSLTKSGGTIVVYMGGQTLGGMAAHFIEAGMAPNMPAIAIENASLGSQRTLRGTIASLPRLVESEAPTGPILIMIGEAMHETYDASALDEISNKVAAASDLCFS